MLTFPDSSDQPYAQKSSCSWQDLLRCEGSKLCSPEILQGCTGSLHSDPARNTDYLTPSRSKKYDLASGHGSPDRYRLGTGRPSLLFEASQAPELICKPKLMLGSFSDKISSFCRKRNRFYSSTMTHILLHFLLQRK